METLYHQTNHILQEIEQNFQKLVKVTNQQENLDIEKKIQTQISVVNSNCDRLDVLLYKIPVSQRQSAKLRVDQIKYDLRHLQSSLKLYLEKKKNQQIELSEREQLLSHRFNANTTNNAGETCLNIDHELQHRNQLQTAHQGVDDMIASGSNILGSLINQRETLKGAQKRIYTIGSTLGLSNHTMKLIERRVQGDKYVLYGGIFMTLLIIGLFLYFVVF